MTTPAMPELPEPELGYIETDKSRQPAFSARQMREALQSAQPAAAVSDDDLQAIDDAHNWQTLKGRMAAYRAILALRPQAVPMTEWQPMSTAPSSKTVLLAYKNEYRRVITVKACYYPKHTEEASEEDAALDYDEATDTYYVAAGWYEDNSESEINYGITGEFLGWLPVPVFAHHGITAQGAQGEQA